jgi:hypothetical protein
MTLKNFLKEITMNENVWTLSLLTAVLAIVGAVGFYNYTSMKSMERNIESAIAKGIDPVAVRCAYGNSHDNICIAYAVTVKK